MTARMPSPAFVLPNAMQAVLALNGPVEHGGVPEVTLKLVDLRASQINGCGLCVDMHSHELKKLGQSSERIFAVAAWRDAPWFTEAERAALALTEAVTRIADKEDAVPDAVWNEAARHYDEKGLAALVLAIAKINVWNRLNVATRQPSNAWRTAAPARAVAAVAS